MNIGQIHCVKIYIKKYKLAFVGLQKAITVYDLYPISEKAWGKEEEEEEGGNIHRNIPENIILDSVFHGRDTMDDEVQVLLPNKPQVHKLDMYQIIYYYRFQFRYSYQFKVRKIKIKLKVVPVL